jgi:hypothetical protein
VGIQSLRNSGINNFVRSRSMLVGNEAFVPGSFELITTTVLNSAQSSIVFDVSPYNSTYKHLQIRYTARSSRSATADNLGVRFNGITTNSYSHHRLTGDGSNAVPYTATSTNTMLGDGTTAANATANAFSAGVIDILDPYSTTKNKVIKVFSGYTVSGDSFVEIVGGAFYSTDPLESVEIVALSANLVAGTRMSIYGIKG